MSKLEVNQIDPQSGTTLTIGSSGDTIVIPSGVNLAAGAVLTAPVLEGTASSAGSILFKEDTDNGTNAVTLKGPAATADVTLTLPAATDTVVGRATTDTLTNKTINSAILATPTISGSSSSAGQISFKEDTDNGTNSVTLKGAAATADVTLTLPAVAGDIIPGKFEGTNFTGGLLIGHADSGTLNNAQNNTGVGIGALDTLTSGDNNTVMGFAAGDSITSGGQNTYLGTQSGTNSNGNENVGVGHQTLIGASGTRNTVIGMKAGHIISGDYNICAGWKSGDNITSGDGNVIIGGVDAASATGDRQLIIAGNDGSTTTTWISGDSSGNLVTPGTITANGTVLSSGGLSNAQQWRLTSNFTNDAAPIASNLEEADTDGYGRIGNAMTQSSGVFTFPTTGYWYINFQWSGYSDSAASDYVSTIIQTTTNNSSFGSAAEVHGNIPAENFYGSSQCTFIFDVTNTSTHKVRFMITDESSYTVTQGDSGNQRTGMTFIKLGDT